MKGILDTLTPARTQPPFNPRPIHVALALGARFWMRASGDDGHRANRQCPGRAAAVGQLSVEPRRAGILGKRLCRGHPGEPRSRWRWRRLPICWSFQRLHRERAQAMQAWTTQPANRPWLGVLRDRRAAALPPRLAPAMAAWPRPGSWTAASDHRSGLSAAFRDRYPNVLLEPRSHGRQRRAGDHGGRGARPCRLDAISWREPAGALTAERCARLLPRSASGQSRFISLAWLAEATVDATNLPLDRPPHRQTTWQRPTPGAGGT